MLTCLFLWGVLFSFSTWRWVDSGSHHLRRSASRRNYRLARHTRYLQICVTAKTFSFFRRDTVRFILFNNVCTINLRPFPLLLTNFTLVTKNLCSICVIFIYYLIPFVDNNFWLILLKTLHYSSARTYKAFFHYRIKTDLLFGPNVEWDIINSTLSMT